MVKFFHSENKTGNPGDSSVSFGSHPAHPRFSNQRSELAVVLRVTAQVSTDVIQLLPPEPYTQSIKKSWMTYVFMHTPYIISDQNNETLSKIKTVKSRGCDHQPFQGPKFPAPYYHRSYQ